jgi:hypothetical protein
LPRASRNDGRETSSFSASSRSAAGFSPGLTPFEDQLLDVVGDGFGDLGRAYGIDHVVCALF